MIKSLWNIFGSPWLTAALTLLICVDTAFGSILVLRHRGFYQSLDMEVLLPYLVKVLPQEPLLVGWIVLLIVLVALFAINTAVCTLDRLYRLFRRRAPLYTLIPQLVHIGFLIALMGHLWGSVDGFRSYGNIALEGEKVAVPHTEGLYMRLDGVEAESDHYGRLNRLSVGLTLFEGDRVVKRHNISINDPLIYRGIAFYYLKHGRTLRSLLLDVDGSPVEARLGSAFRLSDGRLFYLGRLMYSEKEGVPYVEVLSDAGGVGYLRVVPSASLRLDGVSIVLKDYGVSSYVVLTINRDPGIALIGVGSAILVAGMVGLLFVREDRRELVG